LNFKKTIILALVTIALGIGIYYFEFIRKGEILHQKENSSYLMSLDPADINFFQIKNDKLTITVQKNNQIWQVIEPVQDLADQGVVSDLIKTLAKLKSQSIEIAATAKLEQFGLEHPKTEFLLKSRHGFSEKIQIGDQKNFEGQLFAKVNNDLNIRLIEQSLVSKVQQSVTFFREKKLYRQDLAKLVQIKIKSLRDQFTLRKSDQKWISSDFPDIELDQNKVRQAIKDLADVQIQEYMTEGEPSESDLKSKNLLKPQAFIEFESSQEHWNAALSVNESDKGLYALTSRPSFLVKLDIVKWEKFANASLDSLRDRKMDMTFSLTNVQKVFVKVQAIDYDFKNENQTWKLLSKLPDKHIFLPIQVEKFLNQIHDLEISEFVSTEMAKKFEGKNTVILKSSDDRLIFQMMWGPLVQLNIDGLIKDVYLVRSQLSKNIFAIDKDKIDGLGFNRVFQPVTSTEAGPQDDSH
jgi:hypothetical protein